MNARAQWLRDAGWGVFTHYLSPKESTIESWQQQIDAFDVPGLVSDLKRIGTKYYFITIGQNSGFFCAPNATYDRLAGRSCSHLSRRDLVDEIARALTNEGIRTCVYLPCNAPADDVEAVEALACTPDWDASQWQLRPGRYRRTKETDVRQETDVRLSEFQRNWEAIIREWSKTWGERVHAWWFDGCYYDERMYRHTDEPNFKSFAAAARAGNPDSLVAFNPGVKTPVICHTEHEDFTAGEIAGLMPATANPWDDVKPEHGMVNGAQYHILSYLGQFWGRGEPRFSTEFLVAYTRHIVSQKGAITWDIPIGGDGRLPEPYVTMLSALNAET